MDWIDLHQKLQNSHTLHQSPVKENASSLRRSGGKTFQIMQDYISHPVPVSVTSWIYYHYKYDAGLEFWYQAFEFCWWCLCLHLQYNYGNEGSRAKIYLEVENTLAHFYLNLWGTFSMWREVLKSLSIMYRREIFIFL